jgi:hypothetical protein
LSLSVLVATQRADRRRGVRDPAEGLDAGEALAAHGPLGGGRDRAAVREGGRREREQPQAADRH